VNLVSTSTVALKKQESHQESLNYAYLFESAMDGVMVTDEFGFVQYTNKNYEMLFGVSRYTEIGKHINDIGVDELILNALKKKNANRGYISPANLNETIEVVTSPLYDGKHFGGLVCNYRIHKNRVEEEKIKKLPVKYENKVKLSDSFSNIIGDSQALNRALMIAERASRTDTTVLIRGESGTGKELVAYAMHQESKRSDMPFIAVNCGAIPSTLIESELFGHEKGSFTGALSQKIGKFEQATGGTIFLDEIGDLPIDMQVKILRVLQDKSFYRVGGSEEINVDIRIIAATHKNLEQMIQQEKFREDLYYRLNVIPVNLPALRERSDDIPHLIAHFINIEAEKYGYEPKQFSDSAWYYIQNYEWTGNVRELQNVVERLMILCPTDLISESDLPKKITENYYVNERIASKQLINLKHDGKLATMEEYERDIIQNALERFGSFNAAGKVLGLTHKTVAAKARKYKIIDSI